MSEAKHPDGDVLQAFHDGELNAERATRVEEHCRNCVQCRADLTELDRLDGLLADIDAPALPRPVWPGVAEARRKELRGRLGTAFAFSAAGVCVAGIAIGLLLGPVGTDAESSDDGQIWEGPSSLWSGGASVSLLEVYTSDLD